jgi:hypothetical protein
LVLRKKGGERIRTVPNGRPEDGEEEVEYASGVRQIYQQRSLPLPETKTSEEIGARCGAARRSRESWLTALAPCFIKSNHSIGTSKPERKDVYGKQKVHFKQILLPQLQIN